MAVIQARSRFREKVDANHSYPVDEAVALLKEFGTAKFNETVEVAVNLGVDARKSDQVSVVRQPCLTARGRRCGCGICSGRVLTRPRNSVPISSVWKSWLSRSRAA